MPELPDQVGLADGLSVVVLGCDGSWTGPGGAGSSYLVSSGQTRVLFDLGPGAFANLQTVLDPALVDAVVLSHRHPDHWTDLHSLVTRARIVRQGGPVPVYAPEGLARRSGLAGSPWLGWNSVADGQTLGIGSLTTTFHRTDHGVETLAVRVDGGGRTLGYSADTGPGWPLSKLGPDLDLVLCEATFTTEHEGTEGHMSARQAGEQARQAGAGRLVVTHRRPNVDPGAVLLEAEVSFGRPVEQAAIGREFVL